MFNLGSTEPVTGRASTSINCSAREPFQYLGEDLFLNYPKWSSEVKELEQITPGPVQLGTIGRQVRVKDAAVIPILKYLSMNRVSA